MSAFPSEKEMARINEAVAALHGLEPGIADPEMLRAIMLGIRLSRRGDEARRGHFERAAALVLEILGGEPFVTANAGTALAGALLYLERRTSPVELEPGQAREIVEGVRAGTMDEARLASLLRLRARERTPSRAG